MHATKSFLGYACKTVLHTSTHDHPHMHAWIFKNAEVRFSLE